MTYEATVVKVFLASPGDVADERNVAREVIHEWNAVNSADRRLVLQPVGWETHAAPEMGRRPQAVINAQLLHSSDLLVAIFWTRLGTPTGESPSGTVEEIREHVRAGKPAAIYFSNSPVRPDSVDEGQYRALRTFRSECERTGLLETYGSIGEFRTKFARQLAQAIIRSFPPDDRLRGGATGPAVPVDGRANLSADARELLGAAINGPAPGSVTLSRSADGDSILVGPRDFTEPGTPRAVARWKAALQELEDAGLIADSQGDRSEFDVTDAGYRRGDELGLTTLS